MVGIHLLRQHRTQWAPLLKGLHTLVVQPPNVGKGYAIVMSENRHEEYMFLLELFFAFISCTYRFKTKKSRPLYLTVAYIALSLNTSLLLSAPISWSLVLKSFSLPHNISTSHSLPLLLKSLSQLVYAFVLLSYLKSASLSINAHLLANNLGAMHL